MGAMNFSVPDDVKERFNRTFADKNAAALETGITLITADRRYRDTTIPRQGGSSGQHHVAGTPRSNAPSRQGGVLTSFRRRPNTRRGDEP